MVIGGVLIYGKLAIRVIWTRSEPGPRGHGGLRWTGG